VIVDFNNIQNAFCAEGDALRHFLKNNCLSLVMWMKTQHNSICALSYYLKYFCNRKPKDIFHEKQEKAFHWDLLVGFFMTIYKPT